MHIYFKKKIYSFHEIESIGLRSALKLRKKYEKIVFQNKIMLSMWNVRETARFKYRVSCHVTTNYRNNMKGNTDSTHTKLYSANHLYPFPENLQSAALGSTK